jgi:hypothetical protein
MASPPFAFSVHHFITSVGSDAGFASIVGLAILVLLYFAQARETSALRSQAEESALRVQQLEARLASLARQPVPAAVQPVAPPPGLARPVEHAALAARAAVRVMAPAPPAGVAAPALTAATRLIPATAAPSLGAQPVGSPAPVIAQPAPATAAAALAASAPPAASVAASAPDATAVVTPPPVTAAGGTNGAAQDHLPPPNRAAPIPAAPAPPRIQIRPGGAAPAGRRALPPRALAPQRRVGSPGRRWFVVLLVALAAVGVVAVLLIVTSGGGSSQSQSGAVRKSNAPVTVHRRHPAAFNNASATVAVLNGTATSGLAHRVSLKLTGAGFKQGAVQTAADQTRTATVVAYMPGHKRDAQAVAASLKQISSGKLSSASVQPVDSSAQTLACPPQTSCAATVVVTVGSDLASTQ